MCEHNYKLEMVHPLSAVRCPNTRSLSSKVFWMIMRYGFFKTVSSQPNKISTRTHDDVIWDLLPVAMCGFVLIPSTLNTKLIP